MEESEIDLLAALGTSIAHCPESNTNLRSGLCDVKKLARNGVTVGLGSGKNNNKVINTTNFLAEYMN